MIKKCIAGNWKMNLTRAEAETLARGVSGADTSGADYVVCPPFLHLDTVLQVLGGTGVSVGAQDCAAYDNGAYTGAVSAAMLKDIGVSHVIIGHSERRTHFNETDEMIRQKVAQAHKHGLVAIVCVGETDAQRTAGEEQKIVETQLRDGLPDSVTCDNTIIAYEPVWAIGTGNTATPEDAGIMHDFIRTWLEGRFGDDAVAFRLLYGGSMKPGNAADLLAMTNINGGLIGGASLKADSFLAIGGVV